jgi:ATP/maltotriose-dependent transcriptional regulator MalT
MLVQQNTLLATKLHIPHLRMDVVQRPRLTRRLNEGATRKLTFVTAPAGFGKTTLLSEWVTQCRLATAWISLHPDDNHPPRFFSYLIAALEALQHGIGEQVHSLLHTSQPPLLEPVLTTLLNALTAIPYDFALVLDDYHFINDLQIHQGLIFLLEHLPLQMHLIIASRVELPIPLAHLRGQGQVTELHDMQQYVEKLLPILGEDQSSARNGLSRAHKSLSMEDQPPVEPLSKREVEIVRFIAAGMSNLEIAQQMVITVGTVKWHLANIYGKLNVHSRTQALARASDLGMLP